MGRRYNSDLKRWEVEVMTPIGPQWQAESQKSTPAVSTNPYASYNPQGRTEQSYYSGPTYKKPTSQEEDLFGSEFGSVLGDALSGDQKFAPSGGKRGGGSRPYVYESMTPGLSKYPDLYLDDQLRRKRYS